MYRSLTENRDFVVFLLDRDAVLRYLSPAVECFTGRAAEELTGRPLWEFSQPEDTPAMRQAFEHTLAGQSTPAEFRILTKAGSSVWVRASMHAREEEGKRIGVAGILTRIAERKDAEQALRESEGRFQVALKTVPLIVFHQDLNLRYTWIYNPVLAWAENDFVGKTDAEIAGTDAMTSVTALKQQVIQTGNGVRQTVSYHSATRIHFFDLAVEPLKDASGKTIGITGAAIDVTELHEKNEQLKQLTRKLTREKQYLEREIEAEHEFEDIIGESATLRRVLAEVEMVAKTDSTVLILGETGTGKELVARAIHRMNGRSRNGFIKLNCSAIPTGLLESELFGHEKGAFTGAITQKIGRLELADQGTLFLDEIGDIPLELQPKLLRVLQDQEFERLGSTKTLRVSVRLVAATNRNLAESVDQKLFRRDLFYRLNVFPVRLPSLRERREDIPLLVAHFVRKFSQRMGKRIERVPEEVMTALMDWKWPGNVRELENFIERSVILSDGPLLHVPLAELVEIPEMHIDRLEEAGREYIIRILRECGGVISGPNGAAVRLGLKRTTLQSKMQRYAITRRDYGEA